MTAALDIIKGRSLVYTLTNKSGGSVAKGDVVVIDAGNDAAFTTTTTGRAEVTVGVVIEENGIANNASGRVLLAGFAPLVNVPASVTRGHYVETHTIAKQATGNSARRSGSFGQFLTGGTTPTAWLWGQTDQTATGGGGGITHAYVGYNTIGGSSEAMVQWRVYTKVVTLASDGFLASIGMYIKNKASTATSLRAGVYDDNSGNPKNLQGFGGIMPGTSGIYLEKTGGVDGDFRWLHIPIGMWLPAGTYYLGVQCGSNDSGSNSLTTIGYDGSGSDKIWTSTIDDLTDAGSIFAISDSTKKYSIRGSLLT